MAGPTTPTSTSTPYRTGHWINGAFIEGEGELTIPPIEKGKEYATRPDPKTKKPGVLRWSVLAELSEKLPTADNPAFTRNAVNRLWFLMMGRGLVHPVDDLRYTNAASNEPLFDAVTADFVRGGFDLRALMRLIMNSAAYQRSAETVEGNIRDDRFYSRYLTRRLPAEVILDAFSQVTGVPQDFGGYPRGTRAMQLPDTRVNSYFLTVFGRPERVTTSAAERMQDPTLPQALHTINGETLNEKVIDDRGVIARMVAEGRSNAEVLDELERRRRRSGTR